MAKQREPISSTSAGKYKVTFVSFTCLTVGAGTEHFILNIIKQAPHDKFDISVVQTNCQDMPRLTAQDVKDALGCAHLYTISGFSSSISFLAKKNRNPLVFLLQQFISKLFYLVYGILNAPTLTQIQDCDLVYLVLNDDRKQFHNVQTSAVYIGSTHIERLSLPLQYGLFNKPARFCLRLLLSAKYQNITGFHFLTEELCRQSLVHKQFDFVLKSGVDTGLFYPSPNKSDTSVKVRFLFVSRLEPAKGILLLINAFKQLNNYGVELHVVGSGSLEGHVRMQADEKRVYYHGILSDADLAILYRECDVFVFPTSGEFYPAVVLEALASGLYVIASDTLKGTFDDFVKLGMLEYAKLDQFHFSQQMLKAVTNIAEIRNRKQDVYNYVKAHYDWSAVSVKLFEQFECILRKRDSYR